MPECFNALKTTPLHEFYSKKSTSSIAFKCNTAISSEIFPPKKKKKKKKLMVFKCERGKSCAEKKKKKKSKKKINKKKKYMFGSQVYVRLTDLHLGVSRKITCNMLHHNPHTVSVVSFPISFFFSRRKGKK